MDFLIVEYLLRSIGLWLAEYRPRTSTFDALPVDMKVNAELYNWQLEHLDTQKSLTVGEEKKGHYSMEFHGRTV